MIRLGDGEIWRNKSFFDRPVFGLVIPAGGPKHQIANTFFVTNYCDGAGPAIMPDNRDVSPGPFLFSPI